MMRAFILVLAALLAANPALAVTPLSPETRCGWIDNPTPGNFFLNDKDGSWTIATQGEYEAKGIEHIPDLSGDQFVDIGPHGYGCGCITATVFKGGMRVISIQSFKQRKLKDCLADPDLPAMTK